MRELVSVGGEPARPGESVQDVIDRVEWGENGVLLGRIDFIKAKLADDEFKANWKSTDRFDRAYPLKFVLAVTALATLVLDKTNKGDLVAAEQTMATLKELGVSFKYSKEDQLLLFEAEGIPQLSWGKHE